MQGSFWGSGVRLPPCLDYGMVSQDNRQDPSTCSAGHDFCPNCKQNGHFEWIVDLIRPEWPLATYRIRVPYLSARKLSKPTARFVTDELSEVTNYRSF
jgi:hypothetical protein